MRSITFKAFLLAGCALALASCGGKNTAQTNIYPNDAPRAEQPRIDPYEAAVRIGDGAVARQEYALAAQAYSRALSLRSDDATVATKLGFALFRAGNADEAVKVFAEVLAQKPNHPDALRGLAHAHVVAGRPDEAIALYRKAIEANGSRDPRLYGGLGAALDMKGQHAEARRAYERGLAIRPNDPGLRRNLAMSYAVAGEFEKSAALLEGMMKEEGNDPRLRQTLALVQSMRGEAGRDRSPARGSRDLDAPVRESMARPPATTVPVTRDRTEVRAEADEPTRAPVADVLHFRSEPGAAAIEPRAAATEPPRAAPELPRLRTVAAPAERDAREVADLLSAAERGPRFVWQEALRHEAERTGKVRAE